MIMLLCLSAFLRVRQACAFHVDDYQEAALDAAIRDGYLHVSQLQACLSFGILRECIFHRRLPGQSECRDSLKKSPECRSIIVNAALFGYFATPPDLKDADNLCSFWTWFGLRTPDLANMRGRNLNGDLLLSSEYQAEANSNGANTDREVSTKNLIKRHSKYPPVLWYIGAHRYPSSLGDDAEKTDVEVHLFEPVWDYFQDLMMWRKGLVLDKQRRFHIHNFGLGDSMVSQDVILANAQTSQYHIFEFSHGGLIRHSKHTKYAQRNETRPALIKNLWDAMFELHPTAIRLGENGTAIGLDMIFLNCLGCEYNVIDTLRRDGPLERVGVIFMLSFMILNDTELIEATLEEDFEATEHVVHFASARYCQMQSMLMENHIQDYGGPWFLERWTHKLLRNSPDAEEVSFISRTWA